MGQRELLVLLLFLLGAVALDQGVGRTLQALHHRLDGRIANGDVKVQAVATLPEVDLLIFGDSRIRGGVDPAVITAKTGMTAYNAAFDGRGTLFARGLQAIRLSRGQRDRCYALSVEVIDLYEPRLLRQTPLLPYLSESPVILELATAADPWAPVKAWSLSWRYNSLMPEIARRTLIPTRDIAENGHRPNHVKWDLRRLPPHSPLGAYTDGVSVPADVDPLGEKVLTDFVRDAREAGVRVVLFTSPMHRNQQLPLAPGELEPVRKIARDWLSEFARQEGIPYLALDEEMLPEMRGPELYTDQMHVNAQGAARFSEAFALAAQAACAE
jgi:hypothetical protein